MPKFHFKKPRIISKKFPEMVSTIDGVTKSLNDLVFSYASQVDKTLQRKRIMMAVSSLILLLVLGSFISPKGKADVSVFYPDTCLGGWVNPQYAQGEPETTSNGDESQFTKHNSAVLPKNLSAEMYCGNFKGKFDSTTKPTKIIVSLALTKGIDLENEDVVESGLVLGTTTEVTASSSLDISTSSPELLQSSTTSEEVSSSTKGGGVQVQATSSQGVTDASSSLPLTTTTTPGVEVVTPQEPSSLFNSIITSVKNAVDTLTAPKNDTPQGTTDTVVIPAQGEPTPSPTNNQVPAPESESVPVPIEAQPPTSYLRTLQNVYSLFSPDIAFAEEISPVTEGQSSVAGEAPSTVEVTVPQSSSVASPVVESTTQTQVTETLPSVESQDSAKNATAEQSAEQSIEQSSASSTEASSTPAVDVGIAGTSSLPLVLGTSTEATSSEQASQGLVSQVEQTVQNNFLEVLYTFDGVTWVSLGTLNEISMKYRTFEIPVSTSTSWSDMSKLQVKVVAVHKDLETPTVYLDGIKVEVLYETTLLHEHPDFTRDTILKDETIGDMRIVTLINSENNLEEVWYMYLNTATSTDSGNASSSLPLLTASSSLEVHASSSMAQASSSQQEMSATSSISEATSTVERLQQVLPKNVWLKFLGEKKEGMTLTSLMQAIKESDGIKVEQKLEEIEKEPDFSVDLIKRIKGAFMDKAVIELTKNNQEELWVYDLSANTKTKIDTGSSTLDEGTSFGLKDGTVFWVSSDKAKVFAYTLLEASSSSSTPVIAPQEKEVPSYNASLGERAEVTFEGIPWKVIIGANGFSFYSERTGEVFSDENGSVAEALRQKFNLDTVLNKEQLSNLNFSVEEKSE